MPCQTVQVSGPEIQVPTASEVLDSWSVTGGVNEATVTYTVVTPVSDTIQFDVVVTVDGSEVDRTSLILAPGDTQRKQVTVGFDVAPGGTESHKVCVDLENIRLFQL